VVRFSLKLDSAVRRSALEAQQSHLPPHSNADLRVEMTPCPVVIISYTPYFSPEMLMKRSQTTLH
ncbi:MAG: hypothetical protein ACKPEQ_24660, partial [Dolichospermum sp.]